MPSYRALVLGLHEAFKVVQNENYRLKLLRIVDQHVVILLAKIPTTSQLGCEGFISISDDRNISLRIRTPRGYIMKDYQPQDGKDFNTCVYAYLHQISRYRLTFKLAKLIGRLEATGSSLSLYFA